MSAERVKRMKRIGICPVCEEPKLDLTEWAPGRFWLGCWHCEANGLGGAAYLRAVAKVAGCWPNQLLGPEAPLLLEPWLDLAAARGSGGVVRGDPAPLPSIGTVHGWHAALLDGGPGLDYLTERRGLSVATLRRFCVGSDRQSGDLTFPVLRNHEVVGLLRRQPRDGVPIRATRARPRLPYPDLPRSGSLLFVAGEIDSL